MLYFCGENLSVNNSICPKSMTPRYPRRTYSSSYPLKKDFCRGSRSLSSGLCKGVRHISSSGISTSSQNAQTVSQNTVSDSAIGEEGAATSSPSNGRVMLIDGTSIIYRAYYKLLAKLHHGHLSHADGNGDWVLTIFSALSLAMLRSDLPFYMVPFTTKI
ncbi:hypothetical protein Sango_2397900 [Sesamum angolense]|uniref:5'-3' exonuclease alpha-helical arch N-terminal domain-containing protein n=1 Tax=Sesamum angolense TaxID=2727404 RepID=A0AAE1W716_9LAMI|nr:hypothetical protein Sango_2397900 [Sesamum angolense]